LKALIAIVPYKIHTILTDNGIQFCDLPKNRSGPTARWQTHMFDLLCRAHGIEYRLTKLNYPWTNGQVERMNRTLKEATVRRYHYDSNHQLRQHMQIFLDAYNFTKRLKTLNGLTPFESVCKAWTKEPNRFKSIRSSSLRDYTPRISVAHPRGESGSDAVRLDFDCRSMLQFRGS
jgi:hypothetical protein